MKELSIKKYLIMLAIGFILIVLDVHVYTGIQYPNDYQNSDDIIGEFQYYTLASTYGAHCTYKMMDEETSSADSSGTAAENPSTRSTSTGGAVEVIDEVFFKNFRIDVFNDLVGFILIIISCLKLAAASKRFYFSALCALCGSILYVLLMGLPFVFNGMLLCNLALSLGISYLVCNLATVFLFVSGLLSMCPDVCCRDERKWCKICWFVTFVLQILVTFIFWLGADLKMLYHLGIFFEALLVLDIVIFWLILHRTEDYIQKTYHKAIEVRQ